MKHKHTDEHADAMIRAVNRIGISTESDRAALTLAVNKIIPGWASNSIFSSVPGLPSYWRETSIQS